MIGIPDPNPNSEEKLWRRRSFLAANPRGLSDPIVCHAVSV